VHEKTRDQARRALEAAGNLFIESERGRGIMLLNACLIGWKSVGLVLIVIPGRSIGRET
jgi:hypothetical protein